MMITFASLRGRAIILSLFCFLSLHLSEQNAFADYVEIFPDSLMVWGVAFSLDDHYVVATTQEGVALMWDRESCGLRSIIVPFPVSDIFGRHGMTGIAWSPTKSEFATAMQDGSVHLWKIDRSEIIVEKAIYSSAPLGNLPGMRTVAFSPDGTLLAAAGHDPAIYIWSTDSASAPLHILKGHTATIYTVAFGRDNSTLISAGLDGTIRFWDVDRETEVRAIKAPGGPVINAAVSPDNRYVAATTIDRGSTVVYHFETGEEVRRFIIKQPPIGSPWSLTFSPHSRYLAVGSWDDSRIRLFGLEQGQEIWTTSIPPGDYDVYSLAFSHNRKFLLAGVSVDAPYLLDAETGVILKRYGEAAVSSKSREGHRGTRIARFAKCTGRGVPPFEVA